MIASPHSKADILVVDDNPDNLRLLCGALKERDFNARAAPSGKLALEAALSRRPDIILMDINMPDMDGYETCRGMKEHEELREIPVIFVSALGETVDKVRAFECGGVDYLTKPVKFEEVEARVNTHLTIRTLQTELESKYQELRDLEVHRDQLTHMVAHDLRSPLGVIIGSLDFVLQCGADNLDPLTRDMVRGSLQAAGVLNRLVDDMLDVSRLEDQKMPLDMATVSIQDVLDEVAGAVSLEGRRLEIELRDDVSTFYGDEKLIRRVLTNFLNNAVKYSPPDGLVRMVADSVGDFTRFQVEDQGRGIPKEYHDKIFEKFGQVRDGSEHIRVSSSGLGLTFCQLAVEAHGGSIGVASEEGEGSTFWFTIPQTLEMLKAA